MLTSPGTPLRVVMLDAQTTDETIGVPVLLRGYPHVVIYVEGTGTTSSGVLTIEEASSGSQETPYGGTWSSITTVNASDVTGGAQKAIHLAVAAYAVVRVRITTAIGGGGSISAYLEAS